jgi:hypothetical protein
MPQTIHVINHSHWVADELAENSLHPVKLTYGLDIPPHDRKDLWWLPQAQAVKLIHSGEVLGLRTLPTFIAPDASLLTKIPSAFLGRHVEVMTAEEAVSVLFEWPESFWKMATAKHDVFNPQVRTHAELVSAVESANLPPNSLLQRSDILADDQALQKEYRAFVKLDEDGILRAKTISIYLDSTSGKEVTVYDGAVASEEELSQASDFIEDVLSSIDFPVPPAFVMDVGSLASESFVVIEFNPVWCSAWYDCNIDDVVAVIERSFKASAAERKAWRYEPDAALKARYTQPGMLLKMA